MKSIKNLKSFIFFNFNRNNSVLLIFLIILNVASCYAQSSSGKIKPSFGIESFSTGNGHGTFYSLYASANKGRNSFSIGPIVQKQSMNLNGLKLAYSRKLSVDSANAPERSDKDLFQLNFFTSIQYTNKLPLSRSTIKNEKLIWGDQKPGLENIRLTTVELTVGFEFYVNITNQLSWKNYFGASVYYHFNYTEVLNHEIAALTLNLGTGICFFINNNKQTKKAIQYTNSSVF